jgi:hypothetical protein
MQICLSGKLYLLISRRLAQLRTCATVALE